MGDRILGRREFLRRSVAAASAAAACGAGRAAPAGSVGPGLAGRGELDRDPPSYDAKGLPTAVLGKTGVAVPRLGVGLGSRFCAVADEDEAQAILTAAVEYGFYFWDTASSYRNKEISSEARIGRFLRGRRGEVFVATKCEARTYDETLREFEGSLARLQTDHVDVYQVHLLRSVEDVEAIGADGGALRALRRLRDEKAARFIGFTGHLSAEAMTEAARRYDFDTMLIALNHYAERRGDMERGAVPAAAAAGLGISVIKVIRPRETAPGFAAEELIRYALSLPHVHCAMIGTDSAAVAAKNAALLRSFQPLEDPARRDLEARLRPFFEGRGLPWMDPEYRDA